VELHYEPFQALVRNRDKWAKGEHYRNPGPIQFESENADLVNITLMLEHHSTSKL
jgi:hypothetical protein